MFREAAAAAHSFIWCCVGVVRLLQVVQQLLRHGADLHNLDNNTAKPLDFRKYFEERRDDIMHAVQDILEYRRALEQTRMLRRLLCTFRCSR